MIERLQDLGYTVIQVEIGFAGLFDTVSSWGLLLPLGVANNVEALHLDAVTHAKSALHLTAADEYRLYFALTNIRSGGARGREYCLPGSHSDVGGGYRDEQPERQVLLDGGLREAERDRAKLIQAGWYRSHEIRLEGQGTARLTVDRPGIKNHYSRIPLHIMAKAMVGQGMKFRATLDEDEVVPKELHEVQQTLEAWCTGPSKTDPNAWRNNHEPWLMQLRHDYLHFSARQKTGHTPRFKDGRRERETIDG